MTVVEQKMVAALLVSQLPPDQVEALIVLGFAGELVRQWVFEAKAPIPFPRPVEAR